MIIPTINFLFKGLKLDLTHNILYTNVLIITYINYLSYSNVVALCQPPDSTSVNIITEDLTFSLMIGQIMEKNFFITIVQV